MPTTERAPGESWSAAELRDLRSLARVTGGDLAYLSRLTGRPRLEINAGLDALLGRTPEQAAAAFAQRDHFGGWLTPRGLW